MENNNILEIKVDKFEFCKYQAIIKEKNFSFFFLILILLLIHNFVLFSSFLKLRKFILENGGLQVLIMMEKIKMMKIDDFKKYFFNNFFKNIYYYILIIFKCIFFFLLKIKSIKNFFL